MRKLYRDQIAMMVIAYLLFFLGWWLFGVWTGFAMMCSYLAGLISVIMLSAFWVHRKWEMLRRAAE